MRIFRRFWFWMRRRNLESDFEEEVRHHLELKIQQNLASGMARSEAVRAAHLEFGNPALAKEHSRLSWGFPLLESVLQDVRYAARQLRKNSGFTAVAVFTLALGSGANSAIFSVVNAVLLRPLPYKAPDRLVFTSSDAKGAGYGIAYQHYEAWKSQSRSFEDLAVFYRNSGWSRVTLKGEEPESAQGTYASANLFQVLGVDPARGRVFTEQESVRQEHVVVLSDGLWRRRFAARDDILGKTLPINGQNFEIIGVMPQVFHFPAPDVQFWAPITTNSHWGESLERASDNGSGADGFHWRWMAIGRLNSGIPAARAQSELNAISRQWQNDPKLELHAATVLPVRVEIAARERFGLYLLLGAVGFVLLIACGNVANLLLARGAARLREMAVRTALGASRTRILRQLLTESLLLALVSCFLGLLIAHYGARALIQFGPGDIPRLEQSNLDGMVLAFALTLSVLSAVLSGLAPAVRVSRAAPGETLKAGGFSKTHDAGHNRLSAALVTVEFALSAVLLAGAGLLTRSFLKIQNVNPGFQADHVVMLHVGLTGSKTLATHDRILQRLQAVSGVKAVGAIDSMFSGSDPDLFGVRAIEGQEVERWGTWTTPLAWNTLSGNALTAMGAPLIRGRYFSSQDGPDTPPVALIDQRMAQRYWPNRDPVGQHLKGWDPRGYCTPSGCKDEWVTVIGVVGDMRRRGREREPVADVFEWYRQGLPGQSPPGDFIVRTAVDPAQLAATLRGAVHEVDKTAVISAMATMQTQLEQQLGSRRFQTWLLALFAMAALILAATGIYGVMHYVVSQRTKEMGIRMAVGARSSDIFRLVIGQGVKLALFGLMIGTAAALALVRMLQSLLFGVQSTDAITFSIVLVTLCMSTIVACTLPARRATRVNPIVALREE